MSRHNQTNQQMFPNGYGNNTNNDEGYELSNDLLDEQELRLLQQQQYLQQKQLEQEQQELELYEFQLQKQLAQQRLAEQQRLLQLEQHRRQLHVARQQQQQQLQRQQQREHLQRQHQQQQQQQLLLQRQLQQQQIYNSSPQIQRSILQSGVSQLSLDTNSQFDLSNNAAEYESIQTLQYPVGFDSSSENNQQNPIFFNTSPQSHGNNFQSRGNNRQSLDNSYPGTRMQQSVGFENTSQQNQAQKIYAANSQLQGSMVLSGNAQLDASLQRNQLPKLFAVSAQLQRSIVRPGNSEFDNSNEGIGFDSSTSSRGAGFDTSNGNNGFSASRRGIDHDISKHNPISSGYYTNTSGGSSTDFRPDKAVASSSQLQFTDQAALSRNSNHIDETQKYMQAPSSNASIASRVTSDNLNILQQSHQVSNATIAANLERVSAAPSISATENPNDLWLPPDYEPTDLDICSGRGKAFWNHSGNVAFRNLIQSQVEVYINAPTKAEKSAIVVAIVDELRRQGCKFLKQEKTPNGEMICYDIGDAFAREKVGHSLRDQVTAINRTSTSSRSSSPIPASSNSLSPKPVPVISINNAGDVDLKSPRLPFSSTKSDDESRKIINNERIEPPNVVTFDSEIPVNEPLQRQQRCLPQQQSQQLFDLYNGGSGHNRNKSIGTNPSAGQPSVALVGSGNEAETSRITIDKSSMFQQLGRAPLHGDIDLGVSTHTSRTSTQQRSALFLEELDDDEDLVGRHNSQPKTSLQKDSSTLASYEDDEMGNSIILDLEDPNKMMKQSSPPSKFGSRGLNGQDSSEELIMSSIQTFDVGVGGTSGPSRASARMSGTSNFLRSGSIMRESGLGIDASEMSLLDSGLFSMSLQEFGNSISDNSMHYTPTDNSRLEI